MTSRFPRLTLLLALWLGITGCASRSLPSAPDREQDVRTITITPRLALPRGLQAIVKAVTAADIHRVEIVPYLKSETEGWLPLSKSTGAQTQRNDPDIIKTVISGEELQLERAITLTGLRTQKTYRILAHAFDLQGQEITSPFQDGITVTVTDDDRPRIPSVLWLELMDTLFVSIMPVQLELEDPMNQTDHLRVQLFLGTGDNKFSYMSPRTLAKADVSRGLVLTNLRAQTAYRLEVTARPADPEAPDLATGFVEVVMGDDDTMATQSLKVVVP